jgi:hypothetical protein
MGIDPFIDFVGTDESPSGGRDGNRRFGPVRTVGRPGGLQALVDGQVDDYARVVIIVWILVELAGIVDPGERHAEDVVLTNRCWQITECYSDGDRGVHVGSVKIGVGDREVPAVA